MLATGLCCQETAPWHQPKREDYYPSHFSESAKLTNDPMRVTESHWLKNQQCIVYRFQSGLCPCAAFAWTWRWTCGATSTAGENLTYKVKSRPFKFHDSITSLKCRRICQELNSKSLFLSSEKDKENCCLVFSPPPPRAIIPNARPLGTFESQDGH